MRHILNRTTARTALVSVLLLMPVRSSGQTMATIDLASLSAAVDQIFSGYNNATPGCAVGVIHNGEYVHKKGYGLANLEHEIPITPKSVFRTGSVSKQFTAMVLAILAERGEIDLEADIHTYLPDLIEYGYAVSIRQVILHMAGMPDYEEGLFFKPDGTQFRFGNEDYWTTEEFYEAVREEPLRAPPDSEWYYSNLGYFLLSQVAERATGKTLRQLGDEEIFAPLGMSATFFNDNADEPVKNRAAGYKRLEDGSYEIYMTNLDWVGDGGIYTNLDDFIYWDRNFDNNKLGSGTDALIETTTAPSAPIPSNDRAAWDDSSYGYGLFVGTKDGHRVIGHTGGWVGFSSIYLRYPDLDLSIVTLCNSTDIDGTVLGNRVARLYVEALSTARGSGSARSITDLFEGQFVEHWQAGDASALASLWAADGDWSSVVGSRRVIEGTENLEGIWKVGLQGRDSSADRAISVQVDNIRFLGTDHALVDVLMEFAPGSASSMLEAYVFVLRQEGGAWQIVSARAARMPTPQ